jgi:hypothetical protein
MKRVLPVLLLLCLNLTLFAQTETWSEVKIAGAAASISTLAGLGLPVEEGFYDREGSWTTVLEQEEIARVRHAGFQVEILHADYPAFIENRNRALIGEIENINLNKNALFPPTDDFSYPVPEHFELGSMGGYHHLQEVLNELDSMHLYYPDLITVKTAAGNGNSIQGRPVYYVKISDNPGTSEAESRVFYNSLIHAREPMGMQQLLYFMWYLLENYETSDEVKYLVDNLELYFMPVANPDGYEFNHSGFPIGGGQWRKNRRDNGGGEYGVDLNRNFGFKWGYDNNGSSPNPWEDNYRGTAPFSEPETQIFRDFVTEKGFRIAMNYHTYSNFTLYPWCWQTELTPDSVLEVTYADFLTRQSGYISGTPGAILYNTNGDAMDWEYGEQTTKEKVICFTTEIGGSNDGFWPIPNRIIPLAQENMYANLMIAHFALRYAEVNSLSPVIVDQQENFFKFEFTRYGMDAPANYRVAIEPLDTTVIVATGPAKIFANPVQFQGYTDSIAFTLAPGTEIGTRFQFVCSIGNGLHFFRDTITRFFGPPLVVFRDSCNTMDLWNSTKWNVSHTQFFSPDGSITDSPGGNYTSNGNWPVTMNDKAPVGNSPVAVVNFMTKWNIEKGYDYVQFKVSDDNGFNWYPLEGKYTTPGTLNQASGQPVYDGKKTNWHREEIILEDFTNRDLKFRYVLKTDAGSTADGFYFDDFTVTTIDMTGVGTTPTETPGAWLSEPAPNPASARVIFRYSLPDAAARTFTVTTLQGTIMMELPVTGQAGTLEIRASDLSPGVYLCRITGPAAPSTVKKLVVIR